MALPSNYRWIAVGNLAIRNRANAPHYAPAFVIGDLIAALTDRIAREDVYRPYSKSSRLMWCADLAEDNDYYRLILQVGDKNVSGVSFLHFETLETRDIEKDEDEGGHYAAHILIKKTADHLGRHLILIEKVPGIYLSSVKDHFAWVCKSALYEKEAQDDDGDTKRFRPVFEIDGHQSKTIREALRTGTLQDVEFIGHEENHGDGLDEDPIVEEVVHEARWEVKKRVTEDQAQTIFGRVGDFLGRFRDGADDTQIFVRIKAANGQIKRTEVHHNGDEILEQTFVQNEIVSEFDPPLTQRYEAFRQDMIQKMIDIANNVGA
ncbi:hypothetical protein J0X12_03215 [Sneathiella sp. CAU 1612]|uniref:Uncharacterized protein n=1 Tax=Sneathiella sedimenti TaxID=2816034 RepID=A0ABS3F3U0_9PROT|nr:hypothetical protein [Sneathiella sedimenti]MBO0332607.1 hypothetical protein [Sneathiella sedimenti]